MTATRSFLGGLGAAACLLLSVPAWSGDEAPPPTPAAVEPVAAGVQALIRQGRFEEALAILQPLANEGVIDADTLFLYGLAALGAAGGPDVPEERRDALLDEAIAAFLEMLVSRPELVRVRLELARAFFLKGEDRLATRHFEQVLAGEPPPPVVQNVNRFLARIQARKRWSMNLGFAIAPDNNIGSKSEERIINIIGLPFELDEPDSPTSGVGISMWVGGDYEYPLNERLRVRTGADMSRREYRGSEFDRMSVSVHAGPRWQVSGATETSLLASVRQHWTADEIDSRELGFRIEARHRLTSRTTVTAGASRHERRYRKRIGLDGPVTDATLGVSWLATPTVGTNATLGWGQDRPERERQRNERRWAQAGVTVALPGGFTVGGSATLRLTDYEGNWLPFTIGGEPRKDRLRSLRLNVHNRAVTLAGFSPRVSAVRETRTSNAQLHDYQRTSGELSFVRVF